MTKLTLSPDLSLPAEAITETFGVLAKRGAGKTYTAKVMAEEMYKAGLPFVVVDPAGVWWGLRVAGKGAGLELPVLGGRHGDIPLERTAGELVADLIVDERLSCVLDVSDFDSEAARRQFLLAFAQRLYKRNEEPLHLFLEEADDYIPQRVTGEMGQLLRAWENIVRRGRTRGLGITLISQRSAAINKSVLTQIETLIVLRTTGPTDRKAIEAWVEYHSLAKDVLESLPTLADGEAWVWSPHWLAELKRVRIRQLHTFDSSSTPKGASRRAATMADVDLGALEKRMADVRERAKAEDPRELRQQIAELQRQLRSKPTEGRVEEVVREVTVPVFRNGEVSRLEKAVGGLADIGSQLRAVAEEIGGAADEIGGRLRAFQGAPTPAPRVHRQPAAETRPAPRVAPRRAAVATAPDGSLGRAERRILSALAQYPDGRTKRQVAVLTGYAIGGGGFNNALGALRSRGFVDGRDHLKATDEGVAALGSAWEPLPTGRALLDHWMSQLPKAERSILLTLWEAHPSMLSKEEVAIATEYEVSGGGFNNALGKLRTLELIEGRGDLRASDDLFD